MELDTLFARWNVFLKEEQEFFTGLSGKYLFDLSEGQDNGDCWMLSFGAAPSICTCDCREKFDNTLKLSKKDLFLIASEEISLQEAFVQQRLLVEGELQSRIDLNLFFEKIIGASVCVI
jgi:hypothetical protein